VDPSPPAAVLKAAIVSSNTLRLAWPASAGNFDLYATATLDASGQWNLVTNPPALLGDQWAVDVPPSTNRAGFYRLQR
jgi:hypothetical protein